MTQVPIHPERDRLKKKLQKKQVIEVLEYIQLVLVIQQMKFKCLN